MVSVRDVIFNEDKIWDGKPIQRTPDEIKVMDETIEVLQLPESETEDVHLGEDMPEDVDVMPSIAHQNDQEAEDLDAFPETEKQAIDDDLAWAEHQYPSPNPSILEAFLANSVSLPVENADSSESEGVDQSHEISFAATATEESDNSTKVDNLEPPEPAVLSQLQQQQDDRFYDFSQHRVPSKLQTAFSAGLHRPAAIGIHRRDLPPEPANYRQLKGHQYEKQFCENMEEHMREHRVQFRSWETVAYREAKGHQVLGCQWVYKYKTDKHGRLQKCKARLVVCGNQQKHHDLPTRATTLAMTSLRVLLAVAAKFDLETLQLDAVNAFVHADLDETVFMRMPPGYGENGKVLRLNCALYGLRRSPLLWQQKLTSEMKRLGFKEIPQEPCVM